MKNNINIKEYVGEILNAIETKLADPQRETAKKLVTDFLNSCNDYVTAVYNMETSIQVARFRLDDNEYRETIMRLDRHRKTCHNCLVNSVNIINRIADMVNCEHVLETKDVEERQNRRNCGNLAIEVVKAYFDARIITYAYDKC